MDDKKDSRISKLASINIPFYNSLRNDLDDCLASIRRYTHYPYELVLVDDGSEDSRASELAESNADVYVRHDCTEGIAKSRHDAVLASSGHYIVTLDSDVVVTPYWLTALVEKFEASQDDSFKVYVLQAVISCWLGFWIKFHELYDLDRGLIIGGESTACMLFERSLIELIGNFEPELYNFLSDLDFCRRVYTIDLPGVVPKVCVTPEVVVYHRGWVTPLTCGWSDRGFRGTRAQDKFASIGWQRKKLRGLEILNSRYGIQGDSLERQRKKVQDLERSDGLQGIETRSR